jgi:putative ubiquitin-RnfH superfamily antitoxin RatB of RatAB toxin-antitoxin module
MTSPWEHPPLHDCSACARKRETALQAEVERLHAELASARTVERKDLHEQVSELEAASARVGVLEAEVERLTPLDDAETTEAMLLALLAAQEARAQRVEAALREACDSLVGMGLDQRLDRWRAALSQHAATDGQGLAQECGDLGCPVPPPLRCGHGKGSGVGQRLVVFRECLCGEHSEVDVTDLEKQPAATGERPATVPHYDTLEIAPADHTAVVSNAPCPRCGGSGVVMDGTVNPVACPGCAK